jgi:membrane protease YdiL (CAAX protease family)
MKVRLIGRKQIFFNLITAAAVVLFIFLFDFTNARLTLDFSAKSFGLLVLYFAIIVAVLLPVAFYMKFVKRLKQKRTVVDFIHVFIISLLIVAIPEELIFRGLFQGFLEMIFNEWIALAIATAYFGAAHLWTPKPHNVRYAILATIAGFFFGLLFMQTESIIYPMLLHGLVIATWFTFFFKGLEGKD